MTIYASLANAIVIIYYKHTYLHAVMVIMMMMMMLMIISMIFMIINNVFCNLRPNRTRWPHGYYLIFFLLLFLFLSCMHAGLFIIVFVSFCFVFVFLFLSFCQPLKLFGKTKPNKTKQCNARKSKREAKQNENKINRKYWVSFFLYASLLLP